MVVEVDATASTAASASRAENPGPDGFGVRNAASVPLITGAAKDVPAHQAKPFKLRLDARGLAGLPIVPAARGAIGKSLM